MLCQARNHAEARKLAAHFVASQHRQRFSYNSFYGSEQHISSNLTLMLGEIQERKQTEVNGCIFLPQAFTLSSGVTVLASRSSSNPHASSCTSGQQLPISLYLIPSLVDALRPNF
jgi:hypothetical protein